MPDNPDKVIVTNIAALRRKYGPRGLDAIRQSVDALIAADGRRGLATSLIALDDKPAMRALPAPPVTRHADPKQNKRAIDGVYRALSPDYILILGSTDVVPHQDLDNPVHDRASDDPDRHAFGDLPYACEAPYSRKVRHFVGPTRVVGRLPDVTGGSDADYLCGLLRVATEYRTATLDMLRNYFAITAEIWRKSTNLSVRRTFGAPATVEDVPPKGPHWSASQLRTRLHFINCHGSTRSPHFFGQPKTGEEDYPEALNAIDIDGHLHEGTIVAAECCYGGELYKLSATQRQIGICNTYLANKAYGFFGSTTIAYGPEEGNEDADLLCQYVLQKIMDGLSLGHATLEARQHFVRKSSPMDPMDLKTLAQFNLYGDPSLKPLEAPRALVSAGIADASLAERSNRRDRRRLLYREGLDLAEQEPVPERSRRKPRQALLDALHASARSQQATPGYLMSFKIEHRKTAKLPKALRQASPLPTAFHVLFARPERRPGTATRGTPPDVVNIVAFVGKEVEGQLVSVKKIRSR